MARLFDKVLAYDPPANHPWRADARETRRAAAECTPLICDDVLGRCPDWVDPASLSGLRSPWKGTFVEWRNTDRIGFGFVCSEVPVDQVAALGTNIPVADGAVARLIMQGMSARHNRPEVLQWPLMTIWDITEMGTVLDWQFMRLPDSPPPNEESLAELFALYTTAAWMICLANARNVTTVEEAPNPKLSAKWRKRTGEGLVTYKRIMLPHRSGPAVRGTGSAGPVPLSLIKGHFKTYDESKPLLGRHTGTWWWEPHVRGDRAAGEVIHDYQLGER
jgi:hypothetical protein